MVSTNSSVFTNSSEPLGNMLSWNITSADILSVLYVNGQLYDNGSFSDVSHNYILMFQEGFEK